MAQGLFLLHSELVAASRDLLALWQAADPIPGEVVIDHAAAVALMPAFQGYPAVVYEDASGARHCLFNPADLAAVTSWRAGIDNPPPATVMSKYIFSRRFMADEMMAILAIRSTDPAVGLFLQLLDYAQEVDLSDTNIKSGIEYLVSIGKLAQDRATAILTP